MKLFISLLFVVFIISCSSTKQINNNNQKTVEETRKNMEKNIQELESEIEKMGD